MLRAVGESATGEESEDADRYLSIPIIGSDEGYRTMEDFVETVNDPRLRESLIVALRGSKPFRRFKDVLLDYPAEREQWFAFERQECARQLKNGQKLKASRLILHKAVSSPVSKLAEQ